MRRRPQTRKAKEFSNAEGSQICFETLVRKSKYLINLTHVLNPTTLNFIPYFN